MENIEQIQYIGARYITKIYENSQDAGSAEWEANVNYEPLTLVTENNSTYLSRKVVPKNIGKPSENKHYWALTGAYNGQIASLQNQIDDMQDGSVSGSLQNQINDKQNQIDDMQNQINNITEVFVTPEMFDAVGDGETDDTEALQNAINYASTNGVLLLLPAKTYVVSDTLNIPNGTRIEGATTGQSFQTTKTAIIKGDMSGTKPILNISNDPVESYTGESISTSTRTEIAIKHLLIYGNNTAFCGIKIRGYDIVIDDVSIFYCKIGLYCYNVFTSFFNQLNIFFSEIGVFTDNQHSNSTFEKCYVTKGSGAPTDNDLSSIVVNTFGSKLSISKICGFYVYNNSSLTIKNTSIEEEYYAFYMAQNARINAESCSIESIVTGGAICSDTPTYGVNYFYATDLSAYNPSSHQGSIALPGYRSTYYIYSNINKPSNFADPVFRTRGCLYVQFKDWFSTLDVNIVRLSDLVIQDNNTHFNEKGDIEVDFILTSYSAQDLTGRPGLTIGNIDAGIDTSVGRQPIVGTDLCYLPSSTAIVSKTGDAIVELPKLTRFKFTIPYTA